MTEQSCEGILLQSRKHGEGHQFLHVFTEEFGRIRFRAPNASKSKKRFGSHLQSFSVLCFFFRSTQQEDQFPLLLRVESVPCLPVVVNELDLMSAMSFATELIQGLTDERVPIPELYSLFLRFLETASSRKLSEKLLARFELRFLELMGIAPSWKKCMRCGKHFSTEETTFFDVREGGLLDRDCREQQRFDVPVLSAEMRAALKALQFKKKIDVSEQVWTKTLKLLDQRLCHVMGFEPNTRAFLREVQGI